MGKSEDNVVLRVATTEDLDVLVGLWRRLEEAQGPARIFPLVEEAESIARKDFADSIEHDDACVFLAETGGEPVGMAIAWYWVGAGRLDSMPTLDLSRVVVHPGHRGRGIGQALIDAAETFGRERGARYMQAHLFSGNDEGRAFWERRGFVPRYESRVRPILPK